MTVLIDWLVTGCIILLGCILLYPVSRELGNSFRKIFVLGEQDE